MIKTISLAILVLGLLTSKPKSTSTVILLNQNTLTSTVSSDCDKDPFQNNFEIKLEDSSLMVENNLFLIFESENSDFVVSIYSGSEGEESNKILLDLGSFSGNSVMAMSESFFNGKFDFFKTNGSLKFKVINRSKMGSRLYKIRVEIGRNLNLDFGKIYTSRIDSTLEKMTVNLRYNGSGMTDLEKLRFQITSVRQKKDYSLSASVEHENNTYMLNTIFQKTVGGILSSPNFAICKSESCLFTLKISLSKVKTINIETFLIKKIENLSIQHYEEYYDRVYQNDKTTFYNLPFEESMDEMDITVSLIPVTGTTGLYINAKTLPMDLESFDWKEKGPLAKRITIKWAELVQMRAERSNLYIAVFSSRPGEFLIKIDAHEQGYKGRINSGIIESGFVGYQEINNYLYFFEVYETQEITFDLRLNVISGESDLYLKSCSSFATCFLNEAEITKPDILKVEGTQNPKLISHTFRCEHLPENLSTSCEFVIGVKGNENHGTHFEISLQESNFHRLMTPGHSVPLNMNSDQTVYLKFSYPTKPKKANLYLSIEALWGSFDVILSRKESYPISGQDSIVESFISTKLGLYNSLKTILIVPEKLGESNLPGIYYVSVKAKSSCSLNLKFYEKSGKEVTIHTLTAGHQLRSEIHNPDEIIYFTIKVSLENEQASSVSIGLTPLKGQYIMFANRNGKLPTTDNREFYSISNHLELFYENSDAKLNEFIIGIKLNSQQEKFATGSYQFMLSMTYSNKPLKLNPGIISQHMLKQSNYFLIETTREMKTILILKSVIDGYNIQMCASFSFDDSTNSDARCAFEANQKNVSIFINENDLETSCKRTLNSDVNSKCFIRLKVIGNLNQKISIGFTYNDHAFQLTKHLVVTGPMLLNANAKINFIYHAEPGKPIGIYFNTKGRDIAFFTKIVRGDSFDISNNMVFPNAVEHDVVNSKKNGYITNVFYDEKKITDFGSSPEILISIRSVGNQADFFDPSHNFILQVSMDSKEILRTQTLSEHVSQDAWNYYTFYNNGNTESLRVYVSTPIAARLEILLSKGLQSRPPFTNKAIFSKVAIGSAEINMTPEDLATDKNLEQEKLKGHYTVGVKASADCNLNIFWNNKEDLNYLELTPNQPSTMALDPSKALYFSFYAKDLNSKLAIKGIISIYIRSTAETNVYILKSGGELNAPSATDYIWKANLGKTGGVTVIQIRPDHPEYCVECLYIGSIEAVTYGQVSLLANLRHDGQAITLTPGFTFPDLLASQERILYKVYNSDINPIDFSISMLTGFVKFYISSKIEVSENKFEETFSLANKLDTHKFISIVPSKYGVKQPQDFYILVENTGKEPASYTMTVDKNNIISPIEPGITKFLHLAPNESTDFVYTPKENETLFEVRFELRQVIDPTLIDTAISKIGQLLSIYHINLRGDRFRIKSNFQSIANNKVYINFDISQNSKSTFAINLKNPIDSTISFSVDLLNGNYKLINFNEFNVDIIRKDEPLIYEAYGQKSKYLFVDLKVCHGDVNVQFYQGDFDVLKSQNATEYKKITDNNAAIHYIKMEHDKVFLKVSNKKEELSIYEISVFNERDLDNNPYSEIAQGNKGKVEVDTEAGKVDFSPVSIRSTYNKDFFHRVNYTVYMTDNMKVMRYAKNCGNFMIDHAFKDYHLMSFSKVFVYSTLEEMKNATQSIRINIPNLKLNTKYYGIVIAKIDLFPREDGYVSSARSGKVYYDEFVFITAKYQVPFMLLISCLFCVGFFAFLFIIVKAYLFGKIGKMRLFDKLGDLANYDDTIFGLQLTEILENEYYADVNDSRDDQNSEEEVRPEPTADLENDIKIDIEMSVKDDRQKPLN